MALACGLPSHVCFCLRVDLLSDLLLCACVDHSRVEHALQEWSRHIGVTQAVKAMRLLMRYYYHARCVCRPGLIGNWRQCVTISILRTASPASCDLTGAGKGAQVRWYVCVASFRFKLFQSCVAGANSVQQK